MGIKYSVDETFFDTWNNQMAYVLGFWFADGSVEYAPAMRGKYIRAGCTDKEIIVSIKNAMRSEHTIVETKRPGRKTYYLLRIGNTTLFNTIKRHGVTERKSLTTKLPTIPGKYFGDFVRGYFDGDGCVYLDKKNKNDYRRLSTIFTSGSKNFLEQLRFELSTHADMSNRIKITVSKGGFSQAFQLRYSTGDSTKLYQLMYPPKPENLFLKRKRDKFEDFFANRPGGEVVTHGSAKSTYTGSIPVLAS